MISGHRYIFWTLEKVWGLILTSLKRKQTLAINLVEKQVKTGEIVRAQDVRDILGKIASDEGKSSTHIMQDYIKGDIDLEEAHARFEATGRSGDNYEKVKKFQRLISEKDFCDELKKEAVGNSKDILFSLRKINTAVTQLMKEIDKKK